MVIHRALAVVRREWGTERPFRAIRLQEMADAAAVSTGHLTRAFRAEFGMGPTTALERLRLVRAAVMLRSGDDSLSTIARMCGFADQYHLSRRFSAVYGMPPTHYRRRGYLEITTPFSNPGLLHIAAELFPRLLIEQVGPTSAPAPPPLPPNRSFGQTFTVPWGLLLTQVNLYLATWFSATSAVTASLYRLDGDDRREHIVSQRIDPMIDNVAEWMTFPVQEHGRFLLELTEARGTPTWWWHRGPDAAPVGGSALIDGMPLNDVNFIFAATVVGPGGSRAEHVLAS